MIRTILVDDEPSGLGALTNLLRDHYPEVLVVGQSQSVEEGVRTIRAHRPDLVFLDIAMPDGDGFEVMERTRDLSYETIFTTAYDQHAIRAFEMAALHYLLKPIDRQLLMEAVERFRERKTSSPQDVRRVREGMAQGNPQHISLPLTDGIHVLEIARIVRCEADGNYTRFILLNQKPIIVSKTLSHYELLLTGHDFCRVHSRHLVNMKHVSRYIRGKGGHVMLSNGDTVDVAVRRKDTFLERMRQFAFA